MRWLWFVLSAACFAVVFRTHSMGLAVVMLLAALAFLLIGTLALASSRIEGRARSESTMVDPRELKRLREQIEQRKRDGGDGGPAPVARRDPDPDGVDGGGAPD